MKNQIIRQASAGDVGNIVAIVNSCSFKEDGSGQTLPVSEAYVRFQVNKGRFYVAELDGEVIGCVSVKHWEKSPCIGQAELRSLAVSDAHRGNGYGKALVETAVNAAKSLGYWELHTFTQSHLIPMLESAGFSVSNVPESKLLEDCLACPKYQKSCNEIPMVIAL